MVEALQQRPPRRRQPEPVVRGGRPEHGEERGAVHGDRGGRGGSVRPGQEEQRARDASHRRRQVQPAPKAWALRCV